MNRCSLFFFALVHLTAVASAGAGEFLTNRNFEKSVNGIPEGWGFPQYRKGPLYDVIPGVSGGEGGCVKISVPSADLQGLLTFRRRKNYPAGTQLLISGEYRTEEISFGRNGNIFVGIVGHVDPGKPQQPKYWLNTFLKSVGKWTKFENAGRIKYPVRELQLNAGLVKTKGTVYFRNLSLQVVPPSHIPDAREDFVWREAEDVDKVRPVCNWGKELGTDYYSGRGGILLEKGKLDWNFQIRPVTDPVTLFDKPRTWYLWARIYGYLDSPRIMVYRNDRFLAFVDTPGNERTDKKGKYAGPGKYLWVLCGQFTTTGGLQQLSFRPRGRMLADAFLLTTDGKYAPAGFEAKNVKQASVQDISTANMIRAEYAFEGVSDTVTLPLSFRIGGKPRKIPCDGKPAVFHFSLPADIEVKGMSSHWAGENWNRPERWGKKFLTWKKTGSRTVNGLKVNDYEAYLYYLCSNQYMIFLKAAPDEFRSRKESVCEYWLENGGEKQMKERVALKHIAIQPAKPFEKIMIGPDSAPFEMMYYSYPDFFVNLSACGMNHVGFWERQDMGKRFETFRDEAYKNKVAVTATVRQYTGAEKRHIAIGLDGKPVTGRQALTLAMTEKDAPIAETLQRTRHAASRGTNVVFDDEMTNVRWDQMDYSPAVKTLFRKWLAEKHREVAYKEPELIVRDRLTDPVMYRHWVDFKCSRIAYWYSLYRKAFDEGVALAKGKYPENMKPMMMACVQGIVVGRDGKPCNAEAIKEAGYLDYRLLSKYCDIIQMMSYTYAGVKESAVPGDKMEMYNAYVGKNATAVLLLAGGYGTETTPENKVMLKYQLWDCLMQKPRIIIFYAGATLFNAPTLAPVVEAIRIARPYEKFFVEGRPYRKMSSASSRVRLKALELGDEVLLYATNYDNLTGPAETVAFPFSPKSVLDCISGRELEVDGKGFSFDFKNSRGRLFLVTL